MNNKKLQVWLPLLFSFAMIAGIFLGYRMRDAMPGKSFFHMDKRRPVDEILDLIQTKYVDDANMNQLADTAIEAMLAKLDPHSTFIPAKELETVNEEINGSFFGIGIEFSMIEDTMNIVNVLKDGPAQKAGLLTGDKILKANDSSLSGKKKEYDDIRSVLRGKIGSNVALAILRNGKQLQINVSRDMIPVSSIDAAYMIDEKNGLIRINKFTNNTYREFMEALTSLKSKGLQKLILDLRDNGGGVLEEAVEIADEFLSGDKLITYTEGKHFAKKEYRCRRTGQFETGALVVLADEGTASASEILLGALQDWDRATVAGRRSFGKGLVQDQYTLSDNSALRLTIARYYTPVGRSIQRPYTNGGKAYYEEYHNRYSTGEMISPDSIKYDTSKIFKTNGGKKIYGGGGISPDVFIPADTSRMDLAVTKLYIKGTFNDFGYKYFMQHPGLAGQYKDARSFVQSFNAGEDSWQLLQLMAAKDSINLGGISEKEKDYLNKTMKGYIGRQLFRNEGYYEAMNEKDNAVLKAIEILQKN